MIGNGADGRHPGSLARPAGCCLATVATARLAGSVKPAAAEARPG